MGEKLDKSTSSTLLDRLHDVEDTAALEEFCARYEPAIRRYGSQLGIELPDLDDVVQSVLLRLIQRMQGFCYDRSKGKFRGYLRITTRHVWISFVQKKKKEHALGDGEFLQILENAPADDFPAAMERVFDQEIMEMAMERVRREFPPHYHDVYRMRVVEGLSAREVSERLGIPIGTVHVIKSRFEKRLKEVIREIDPE